MTESGRDDDEVDTVSSGETGEVGGGGRSVGVGFGGFSDSVGGSPVMPLTDAIES